MTVKLGFPEVPWGGLPRATPPAEGEQLGEGEAKWQSRFRGPQPVLQGALEWGDPLELSQWSLWTPASALPVIRLRLHLENRCDLE